MRFFESIIWYGSPHSRLFKWFLNHFELTLNAVFIVIKIKAASRKTGGLSRNTRLLDIHEDSPAFWELLCAIAHPLKNFHLSFLDDYRSWGRFIMKTVAIIGILATSIISFGLSLDLCERSSPMRNLQLPTLSIFSTNLSSRVLVVYKWMSALITNSGRRYWRSYASI